MSDVYASPDSGAQEFDLHARATTAHTLGIIAIVMCLLWYCSGFMTLFFALPLSLVTIYYSRTVLQADPDEVTAVYARNGMTLGVISAVFSTIFLLVLCSAVLLYLGLFAAVFASGI